MNTNTTEQFPSFQSMSLLSRLLLVPQRDDSSTQRMMEELKRDVSSLSHEQFDDLLRLANLNHVVMRGMPVFLEMMRACGYEPRRITTAGASDANVFEAGGLPCVNVANGTEHNHESVGHVLATVVADAFDNGRCARIAHRKALAGDAAEKCFTAGGTVEHDVADQNIFFGGEL